MKYHVASGNDSFLLIFDKIFNWKNRSENAY